MPGTAVTKSVVATEPGGKKREEIFVDIIERISVTFSSSVSADIYHSSADSLQ
jgi:AP-4 complex subunit mu-1